MTKTKPTPKAAARRSIKKQTAAVVAQEMDGVFFLKLVLYLLAGAMWIKITHNGSALPLPVGLIIGLLFTTHEHFQIDRKIEFAMLLVAMLVGYFAPFGLYITF